jgi:hypothetical protein
VQSPAPAIRPVGIHVDWVLLSQTVGSVKPRDYASHCVTSGFLQLLCDVVLLGNAFRKTCLRFVQVIRWRPHQLPPKRWYLSNQNLQCPKSLESMVIVIIIIICIYILRIINKIRIGPRLFVPPEEQSQTFINIVKPYKCTFY